MERVSPGSRDGGGGKQRGACFNDGEREVARILVELHDLAIFESENREDACISSCWGVKKRRSAISRTQSASSPPLSSAGATNSPTTPFAFSSPLKSDDSKPHRSHRQKGEKLLNMVNEFTECRDLFKGEAETTQRHHDSISVFNQELQTTKEEIRDSNGTAMLQSASTDAWNAAAAVNHHCHQQLLLNASFFFQQQPLSVSNPTGEASPEFYGLFRQGDTASSGRVNYVVPHLGGNASGNGIIDLNLPACTVEFPQPSDLIVGSSLIADPRAVSREARRRRFQLQRMKNHNHNAVAAMKRAAPPRRVTLQS